jgi:hypothetical protein
VLGELVATNTGWNRNGLGVGMLLGDPSAPAQGDGAGWVTGFERMNTLLAATVFDPVEVP